MQATRRLPAHNILLKKNNKLSAHYSAIPNNSGCTPIIYYKDKAYMDA